MEKQYMYVQAPGMGRTLGKALALVFVTAVVAGVCAALNRTHFMNVTMVIALFMGIILLGGIVAFTICLLLRRRAYKLLENGELTWASVDMDMTMFDEKTLYVYCYQDYYGLKVYFRGCMPVTAELADDILYFLEEQGKIPVMVGRGGIEQYRVLLEDLAYMLDEKRNSHIPRNIIQTVEWCFHKENGLQEASDF